VFLLLNTPETEKSDERQSYRQPAPIRYLLQAYLEIGVLAVL